MDFYDNSLTRRTIIQSVYCISYTECLDSISVAFFLSEELFFKKNIKNEKLFCSVLSKVLLIWDIYKDFFSSIGFEEDTFSVISLSIFKAFLAEMVMGIVNVNILFKEYLSLLNNFCFHEAGRVKVYMNKMVTIDLNSCFLK